MTYSGDPGSYCRSLASPPHIRVKSCSPTPRVSLNSGQAFSMSRRTALLPAAVGGFTLKGPLDYMGGPPVHHPTSVPETSTPGIRTSLMQPTVDHSCILGGYWGLPLIRTAGLPAMITRRPRPCPLDRAGGDFGVARPSLLTVPGPRTFLQERPTLPAGDPGGAVFRSRAPGHPPNPAPRASPGHGQTKRHPLTPNPGGIIDVTM
jgi:hypothetical protein